MNWRALLRRSSSMVLGTGVLLFLLTVWVEREPGGLPLVLVALGSTGLILSRSRPGPD